MIESSQRKLLPTTRPSSSATTEYTSSRDRHHEINPLAGSSAGKSGGKLCAREIAPNASKQIRPHASTSAGVPDRRMRDMPSVFPKSSDDFDPTALAFRRCKDLPDRAEVIRCVSGAGQGAGGCDV